MGQEFTPSQRIALTDTGTSFTHMPSEDWRTLYKLICDLIQEQPDEV